MSKKQELYPYSQEIADKLYYGVKRGISVAKIFDTISHRVDCPTTVRHVQRKYADVISKAKYELDDEILGYAHERMKDGSDKIIDLFLRGKVGINPTEKVQEVDPSEAEESDAQSVLLEKLGFSGTKDAE